MPTRFRPYQPKQMLMLPPDLREWVPEGHLAHQVSELVDGLELGAFYRPYEEDGRRNAPYEPRMMVKVLIYAYATGVFSSRKIARKLEEDVAFRMLAAGNFPQHRTICEFRRRHLKDFKKMFVQVVGLAREMGMVGLGRLGIDGTKVRANASRRKAMSYGRMRERERQLKEEIDQLLAKAQQQDGEEDERYGEDRRGDELPQELRRREDRLAAIEAAKQRLEAAQRAAHDERGRKPGQDGKGGGPGDYEEQKAQSNFTDPESRIMKTRAAVLQRPGGGAAIVATEVSAKANQGQMMGLLEEVEETFEEKPKQVLADAGYCNEADLQTLEARGVDGYIALGREGKRAVGVDPRKYPAKCRMRKKLASLAGQVAYARRKWIAEAPHGWIKEGLGFRRFSLRGLQSVQGEWDLVCLALNIKRMSALMAA